MLIKSANPMVSQEIHDNVPRAKVGDLVQQCINEGAVLVVVTQNPDERTCTVRVHRD